MAWESPAPSAESPANYTLQRPSGEAKRLCNCDGFRNCRTFLILKAEICEGKNTEEKEQDERKERKNRRRLKGIAGVREMGQEQVNNGKKD